jgi:hypothetical protein
MFSTPNKSNDGACIGCFNWRIQWEVQNLLSKSSFELMVWYSPMTEGGIAVNSAQFFDWNRFTKECSFLWFELPISETTKTYLYPYRTITDAGNIIQRLFAKRQID